MPARELLGFSAPLLTNDLTSAALNFAGAIIVGALAGAAEVASLRAVFPIALTMSYVLTSFGILLSHSPRGCTHAARPRSSTASTGRPRRGPRSWPIRSSRPRHPGRTAHRAAVRRPLRELGPDPRAARARPVREHGGGTQRRRSWASSGGSASSSRPTSSRRGQPRAQLPPRAGPRRARGRDRNRRGYLVMNGVRQVGLVRYTSVRAAEPGYLIALAAAALATGAALAVELALSPPLPEASPSPFRVRGRVRGSAQAPAPARDVPGAGTATGPGPLLRAAEGRDDGSARRGSVISA